VPPSSRRRPAPWLLVAAAAALLFSAVLPSGWLPSFVPLQAPAASRPGGGGVRASPAGRLQLRAEAAEAAVAEAEADEADPWTGGSYVDENKKFAKYLRRLKGKFIPMGPKPQDGHRIYAVIVRVRLKPAQGKSRKIMNQIMEELRRITGYYPVTMLAKSDDNSLALRNGDIIGAMVTLIGQPKLDFLNRLNKLVLPRVRDFEGLNPRSFTTRGNFQLHIPSQDPFRELDAVLDERVIAHGFDIQIQTSCRTQPDAYALLKDEWGFPFGDWDDFSPRDPEVKEKYRAWREIKVKAMLKRKLAKKR